MAAFMMSSVASCVGSVRGLTRMTVLSGPSGVQLSRSAWEKRERHSASLWWQTSVPSSFRTPAICSRVGMKISSAAFFTSRLRGNRPL